MNFKWHLTKWLLFLSGVVQEVDIGLNLFRTNKTKVNQNQNPANIHILYLYLQTSNDDKCMWVINCMEIHIDKPSPQ